MRVYYLRHGQAEAHAPSDAARELTGAGRQQVMRVAEWLAGQSILPTLCVMSPFVRARQSAELALATLPPTIVLREDTRLTPDESVLGVFSLLEACAGHPSILLVGHNPLVSDFIDMAVAGHPGAMVAPMPTAGLAVLEADTWGPGCARLVQCVTPDGLP